MSTITRAVALTSAPPSTTRRSRGLRRRGVSESQGKAFIGPGAQCSARRSGEKADLLEFRSRAELRHQARRIGGVAVARALRPGPAQPPHVGSSLDLLRD